MLDLLARNAPNFMTQLSEIVRDKIAAAGSVVTYQDGQLVQSRGDPKPGISIIVSGAVQTGIFGADGTFIMTSTLRVGQTFGEFTLFTDLPRTHDIVASGPTQINQVSAPAFERLVEQHPEILRTLLKTTLVRAHRLLEMMDAIRRLPMRERTAKILLLMLQSGGGRQFFDYRQTELADALGVSRTSLNSALRQLRELGLIETGYGQIRVPDIGRMQNWVSENCSEE